MDEEYSDKYSINLPFLALKGPRTGAVVGAIQWQEGVFAQWEVDVFDEGLSHNVLFATLRHDKLMIRDKPGEHRMGEDLELEMTDEDHVMGPCADSLCYCARPGYDQNNMYY